MLNQSLMTRGISSQRLPDQSPEQRIICRNDSVIGKVLLSKGEHISPIISCTFDSLNMHLRSTGMEIAKILSHQIHLGDKVSIHSIKLCTDHCHIHLVFIYKRLAIIKLKCP